jgi:hypothetical protein
MLLPIRGKTIVTTLNEFEKKKNFNYFFLSPLIKQAKAQQEPKGYDMGN